MNQRKDILERVKHIMKEQPKLKVNCSKLARQLNCDRRTVSRYVEIAKNGEKPPQRTYQKKTDGFEHIIEEKVKTTAPAIAIYHYLAKEHGYTGSYSTIKRYIHNLNIEKQNNAVIRFETNPGIQAQVDWKESLKFKTKVGETIKFNVFLLILGFSRTKFLMVTETRDLQQVELCLACAFKYLGGVPHEILFDNMRSIIDKARTQYSEPVFNENFKVFAEDCGFVPKACIAYRPETKGKVEVTAKLMNRLKVYSGDVTCFDDIRRIADDLNYEINSSVCQATGRKPFELLELEKPFLIKTNLDILTGYFVDTVKRKVSAESMISYEGRKYSVPPQYIGKKVDISDTGSGFDISFNNHFVRHWEKSDKMMNFNHSDYIEIARRSSLKRLDEDEIKQIAERNLEIYDKL